MLTILHASDRDSLARLLREEVLDVGHIHRLPDSDGLEAHLYSTQAQIRRLKKKGWKLEVRENLSERGRERQQEVGKGDRFKGGKVAPKGLGKKNKE